MTKTISFIIFALFGISAAYALSSTAIVPSTIGGLNPYFIQTAASDNHATIANGVHQLYHISVGNSSGTVNWIRFYNAGTGFNGCNSSTNLFYQMVIPGNTAGAGYVEDIALGLSPGNTGTPIISGISVCITGANALNDTTAATAGIAVNIGYK